MTSDLLSAPNSWEVRDLKSMLHGFSDLGTLQDHGPVVMTRGEGIYVEDVHAKRYLEGNSGLRNMVVGFDHPGLIEAVCEQIRKFPAYRNFFGRVSEHQAVPSVYGIGPSSSDPFVAMMEATHFRKGNNGPLPC